MGKHVREAGSGPVPEPVFSPAVPKKSQALLATHPGVRVSPSAAAPAKLTGAQPGAGQAIVGLVTFTGLAFGAWLLLRWIMYAVLPDGLAVWLAGAIGVVMGLIIVLGGASTVFEESDERIAAREWHGQYVGPEDWDEEASAQLLRAQHAVRTIQQSEVNTRGMLDAVQNDVVLPEQLWDLGRVLQQISVLRTEQAELGKDLPEAQLNQVLGAQRRALNLSAAAMEAKVVKLEHYAQQVRDADAVLRVEATVALAAVDNDRYLELLASTEAAGDNELIESLTEETTDLHSTLTSRLAAALETGQTLALPAE